LQALSFLKSLRYPFPHLHTGNVLISRVGHCCITDIENSFLGLQPFYYPFERQELDSKSIANIEVICFGLMLWEMALGMPKEGTPLIEIKNRISSSIYSIIERIFSEDSNLTVDELLVDKFFSGYQLQIHPQIDFDNSMISMLGKIKERVGQQLEGIPLDKIVSPVSPRNLKSPRRATSPEIKNPRPTSPEIKNPRPTNPEVKSPRPTSPEIKSPRPTNPEVKSPRPTSPEIKSPRSPTNEKKSDSITTTPTKKEEKEIN